jgi:transposase-like protein
MNNEDKLRFVESTLKACPELSNREIADMVGVSHQFVNNVRIKMPPSDIVITKSGEDGKLYHLCPHCKKTIVINNKRTNEEKREAVKSELAKNPVLSSRAIAARTGVSGQFVNNIRNQIPENSTTRKGVDGKTYSFKLKEDQI